MSDATPLRRPFGRDMRLKQGREFLRIRREGRRLVCGCLIANWRDLPEGSPMRLGVITARTVGNAVARARARRLLREAFRLHQHDLARPVELVLVAQRTIAGKRLATVEHDFTTVLRRAGLWKAQ